MNPKHKLADKWATRSTQDALDRKHFWCSFPVSEAKAAAKASVDQTKTFLLNLAVYANANKQVEA